jgi:hypothetical protein
MVLVGSVSSLNSRAMHWMASGLMPSGKGIRVRMVVGGGLLSGVQTTRAMASGSCQSRSFAACA